MIIQCLVGGFGAGADVGDVGVGFSLVKLKFLKFFPSVCLFLLIVFVFVLLLWLECYPSRYSPLFSSSYCCVFFVALVVVVMVHTVRVVSGEQTDSVRSVIRKHFHHVINYIMTISIHNAVSWDMCRITRIK